MSLTDSKGPNVDQKGNRLGDTFDMDDPESQPHLPKVLPKVR